MNQECIKIKAGYNQLKQKLSNLKNLAKFYEMHDSYLIPYSYSSGFRFNFVTFSFC